MPRIDIEEELLGNSVFPRFKKKKILVAVTGSVAAYRSIDIIRELIRLGSDVHVMLSNTAKTLIGVPTFEWASGNPVITEITGNIEHVLFAGEHSAHVDAMIIVPATANTISKIALGLSDSTVSLTALVAIGNSIPVLIVPGMHAPMYRHPIIQEHLTKLSTIDHIYIMSPRIEEGKAKVATTTNIINEIIRILTPQSLINQHVIITGGPTREFIDRVRFLSNPASGKTAIALALEAYYRGASVEIIAGPSEIFSDTDFPFSIFHVVSAEEMLNTLLTRIKEKTPNIVLLSAAVADYRPKSFFDGKQRSGKTDLIIELEPTEKIIQKVKVAAPNVLLVSYKAEHHPSMDDLRQFFEKYNKESKIDLMVANDISEPEAGFGTETNHVFIISATAIQEYKTSKIEIASMLFNLCEKIRH